MTERMLEPENPFWRFSCGVYVAPGVAHACLELQDAYGADVNLLLLAAWLGAERGTRLGVDDLAALPGASWRETVIKPLRAIRRGVKRGGLTDPALAAFHAQLLSCELEAERIRQAELFAWAERRFPVLPPAPGLARANLAGLAGDPAGAAAALDRLAQAAETHCTAG